MIVPDLSVAENVFLGSTPRLVSWRELRARTREIMAGWGFDIAAQTPCRELSVEQLQVVEIARALARGAKCVLLDEPTAALERQAGLRLFDRVRQLTAAGVAVLYISHHLEEVFEICADVAVLRDGELVLTAPTAGLTKDDLVAAMVGDVRRARGAPAAAPGQPGDPGRRQRSLPAARDDRGAVVLAVDDLTAHSARGRVCGVSLRVHAGEVVGVTGLLSAGVATLGRAIAGAEPYASGQVALNGRAVPPGRRDLAQRGGIGYIPEDRRAEGFVADARAPPVADRGDHADPRRGRRVEGTAAQLAGRRGRRRGGRAVVHRRAVRSGHLRPGPGAGPGRGVHAIHPAALRPRRAHRRDRGPARQYVQRGSRNGGSRVTSNQSPHGPVKTIVRPAGEQVVRPEGAGAAGSWPGSLNVGVLREVALLPVLVLLIIVGTVVSPAFLTVSNFAGIGQQSSALGVVVAGESLILLIGGMDLSLESTSGLAPMVAAWLIVPVSAYGSGTDLSPYLGIVVLIAVGAAVGLINGLLIVKGRLNGFIVTLGMTIVLAGLQNGIVKAQTLFNLPQPFAYLGSASFGQLPVSLVVTAVIFVLAGLFLRYHRTGRAIYAVGGNPAAARAAGIKVERIKIGVYIAGSILAAIGGLMEAGRVSAVTGQQGYQEGIIFSVFAAAVIGGVSLKGGRGNMIGAASGVILLGIVQDILDLANVSNYWIEAINGAVILFALVLARIVGGESTAEER
jgi:simple sugar transport system permease protein